MYMFIFKGAFNAKYGNNATSIDFSIQDTVIASIIEVSGWRTLVIFLLSGQPPISSNTLLTGTLIIFITRKGEGWN